MHRLAGEERAFSVDVPLVGDSGTLPRALWLNRTIVQRSPAHHAPAALPDGHPLLDVFERSGPLVCVPLQRSQALVPGSEAHELCGARCVLGDVSVLVPPPGTSADRWAEDREQRQRQCLGCSVMPMMGVLAATRGADADASFAGDSELLESIALSVAPMLENARLQQELRKSEQFRENMLDSMSSSVVAVNLSGVTLSLNPAAEALLGWPEDEALFRPIGEIAGPEADEVMRDALEHGRLVRRAETWIRTREGARTPVSFTTSLLRSDRGTVYGAIAMFVDLTPFKRAEERERSLDRLSALGRFTSSIAHEIRNPLAGIAAGARYLTKSLPSDGPSREHLEFIDREIQRLDRVLQDLFDITHPRELRLYPAPLEETAQRALQCVSAIAEARGVTLALDDSSRTPPVAHDADQLEQVLINLVKNAIEASPAGAGVRVSVKPAPPAPGTPRGAGALPPGVRVSVFDQGAGIDEETCKTIFEPFFTTKKGGSGLGLYVSHDIVKRHGGTIAVKSVSGEGTCFTVEIPLEPAGGRA
jgi:PAS domain S-box-containing protein